MPHISLVIRLYRRILLLIFIVIIWFSSEIKAQPLTSDNYSIDLYRGPVLGSSRIIGLGGAYTAIAEGAEGIPFNSASVVNRPYYSQDNFDWGIAFDFLVPNSSGSEFDFDNNGRSLSSARWSELILGANIQYGIWGAGIYGALSLIDFDEGEEPFTATLANIYISSGFSFFNHQLAVAAGIHGGAFYLRQKGGKSDLFRTEATAIDAGILYRPKKYSFRLGASFSFPFDRNTKVKCDEKCPDELFLPKRATLPWEVRIGASYYLGKRDYNPMPDLKKTAQGEAKSKATSQSSIVLVERPDPSYRGGRYLLFSIEAVLIGKSASDAVGPDGFLEQIDERVGQTITLSPRFGVESELLHRRLRLRAGTYYEPSRYDGQHGRIHGTGSLLFRLFDFKLWWKKSLALSTGFDIAKRYSNISLSLSFWH